RVSLCPALPSTPLVYMTREEALRRAFPAARFALELRHVLSRAERKKLEKQLGRRLGEKGYLSYLAFDLNGKPLGFAVLTAEIGRSDPFFLLLAAGIDGEILDIELLEYRESRGSEVRRRNYLTRYRAVTLENLIRRIRRIPVIPGATLSCHAVARAVHKTLRLQELYVEQGRGTGRYQRLRDRFERGSPHKVILQKHVNARPPKIGRASIGLPAMGDVLRVELSRSVAEAELRPVVGAAVELEEALSAFRPGSVVSRANDLAVGQTLDLSACPDVEQALRRAFEAAVETRGRFSPVPSLPDPELAFRFETGALRRVGPGKLDPGGFGKGLAADRMARVLEERRLPWTACGFRSSFCLRLDDGSVLGIATSGSSMRGAHILDPRSGTPIMSHEETTVAARSAFEAEFWSTASFIERSSSAHS
ncbi:MAG: hypothetical protein ACE5F1_22755, partial [Planctomycetota bacterium]